MNNLLIGMMCVISGFVIFLMLNQQKPIVVIDIKGLTNEFLQLAAKSQLDENEMETLVEKYAVSLEEGIKQLSTDYVILSKNSVISEQPDKTDELRDYIASEIIQGKEK